MAEQNTNIYQGNSRIPELFYEMGIRMKKYATWQWIVIGIGAVVGFLNLALGLVAWFFEEDWSLFLWIGLGSFLALILSIFGLIQLIVYYKFIVSVKNIRDATQDPVFIKAYQYLNIGFILQFFGLQLVTFILNLLVYMEWDKWAIFMQQKMPTLNMKNAADGYKWMKIGSIVSIFVGIAALAIPIAYAKVGKAYIAEYQMSHFGGIGVTQPYPLQTSPQNYVPPQNYQQQ